MSKFKLTCLDIDGHATYDVIKADSWEFANDVAARVVKDSASIHTVTVEAL